MNLESLENKMLFIVVFYASCLTPHVSPRLGGLNRNFFMVQ